MTFDAFSPDSALAEGLAQHTTNEFARSLTAWHARGNCFTAKQREAALRLLNGERRNGTITNGQRSALKKAISKHPGWPAKRLADRLSLSTLSTRETCNVARALGIDVDAVIAAAGKGNSGATGAPEAFEGWADRSRERNSDTHNDRSPEASDNASDAGSTSDATAMTDAQLEALQRQVAKAQSDASKANARATELETALAELRASAAFKQVIEVRAPDGTSTEIEGVQHPLFAELVLACSVRHRGGMRGNVWLAGPAGSGKTTAAENAAKALGLAFGGHGAMTAPHELMGYVSQVTGVYQETAFVRLFRDGGICLLDEIDAGSNEALLCLNSALANGWTTLPTGERVFRHPDFVCIGAGNTWGEGPNAAYVGRAKLDAAFLDRFHPRFAWPVDEAMERLLAGNDEWTSIVQRARRYVADNGIKVVISPRASIQGAGLLAAGFTQERCIDLELCAALTADQASGLKRHLRTL